MIVGTEKKRLLKKSIHRLKKNWVEEGNEILKISEHRYSTALSIPPLKLVITSIARKYTRTCTPSKILITGTRLIINREAVLTL